MRQRKEILLLLLFIPMICLNTGMAYKHPYLYSRECFREGREDAHAVFSPSSENGKILDLSGEWKISSYKRPEDAPEDYVIHGPNQMTALPMEVSVSYQEIAHCLDKSISKIEAAILSALEQTPPELYADIVKNGVYLAGGGALLRGLSKRLRDKMNIEFHVADDPLRAVAKGTGIALKNIDKYNFLIR